MKNFKELRQGLTEEKMPLSSRLYKQFKKDIDKIMKKHDAYVSDSNTKYTTISSPKPMQGGFKKDLFKLLGMTESFKPYVDKNYPRCVDFYIQFRGGRGDRITSEENKKDFIKATDMIDAYCKKNKIKQKPVYSTPMEGSSAYKVGLMIDPKYSRTSDYKDGKDLQPLYVSLSKLKTAEDHGGGWDSLAEGEVDEKIKYRGNLKDLMASTKEDNLDEFGSKNMSAADKANLRRRIKNKKNEEVFNLSSPHLTESLQELTEGTWAVPDNQEKLRTLQNKFLNKKIKGTKQNAKKFAKDIYPIFGDDGFFDDLLRIENDPDPMVDIRLVMIKHLHFWNMKFKYRSPGPTIITHAPKSWWEPKEVEETAKKRKPGNIRPTGLGAPMKGKVSPLDEAYKDPSKSFPRDKEWKALCRKHKRHIMALQNKGKDLPNDAEEDFVSWGMENGQINDSDDIEKFIEDELLNASYIPTGYNLFEKYRSRYKPSDIAKAVEIALAMADAMTPAIDKIEKIKRGLSDDPVVRGALRTANESVEEAKGATGLNNAALVKRVPKRFKGIDQDTAQRVADAVKPKGMISSKLYMELGDLWDKKNMKGFEALLKKHKV